MSSSSSSLSSKSSSSEALLELLAPDGYYTYLGIRKSPAHIASSWSTQGQSVSDDPDYDKKGSNNNTIDEDLVKKNYRKLSLRHHPDKPGGDSDTFRILNRAQRVLLNEKLRQQYDILGIDLDDDETESPGSTTDSTTADHKEERPSTAQGIVHEIATTILTSIIQLGVRTLMLGSVSTIVVRFWWTVYPALGFLGFIGYRIVQAIQIPNSGSTVYDISSPITLAIGVLCMHYGRVPPDSTLSWTWRFWFGETLVIGMFTYNSLTIQPTYKNGIIMTAIFTFAALAALWFRGKIWNYIIVLLIIAFLGLFVALAFPIMELVLESILNEKLKLVGEKVRHHHTILKQHYENKLASVQRKSSLKP